MRRIWMLAVCGACSGAMGQTPVPPTERESTKEPTLDELLGLPTTRESERPKAGTPDDAKTRANGDAKTDSGKSVLDRLLTTDEVEEEFEQAVQLMGEASLRLNDSKDSGIETQRMQESILRKLDKLLDDAQRRQQKQQKSSSSSKQQQQQQQQKQGQQPKQQQSASQQSPSQQPSQATKQGGLPGRRDGAGNAVNAGGGAQWGNLPQRDRDSLLQGQGDSYSPTYRSKTEEYYKRLAEEPKAGMPK